MIDLSQIRFIKSPNFRPGRSPDKITHIVLHCPIGNLQGTIATFQNIAKQVSAHYVIDRDGSITQMVQLVDTAWHVCNANPFCIGIEMVDRYYISGNTLSDGCMRDPGWLTNPELTSVVALVASLMQKFNIPLQNVIGHNDPYLRQFGNTHQDPGPYFPWMQFRAAVSQELTKQFTHNMNGVSATQALKSALRDGASMPTASIFSPPPVRPLATPQQPKPRKPRGRKLVGKARKGTGGSSD
jgi:N-acetyl-anhydromuramyl-L-alanine amidase AmpD